MNARLAAVALAPRLTAAGVADAGFEAEYLVRMAGGISRTAYFRGHELSREQEVRLEAFAKRRVAREPSAYIQREREFYGLALEVTPDVLLPRPETELLVEIALAEWPASEDPQIVDVGTGSGAVAIAVARHSGSKRVLGVDLSARALRVAQGNVTRHGVGVRLVQGDLLSAVRRAEVVLANLPYIPTAEIDCLEPEVRDWEPRLALDGGRDGLDLVRRLVADCAGRIRPRLLALEVGSGQAASVAAFCEERGARAELRLDLAGIERVVCARWA